jgi:hypothetical protein
MNDIMNQLRQPFHPSDIEWKPGFVKGDKCMALAYGNLRSYMEVLDTAVGMDWHVTYTPWGEHRIIANLTVQGVTRSSTGEKEDNSGIAGTVAEAQAFKRACAMFGLGRYLYNLPNVWVGYDAGRKAITDQGLAELNSRYTAWYAKKIAAAPQPVAPTPPAPAPVLDVPMGEPGDIWGEAGLSKTAREFVDWAQVQADADGATVSAAQYGLLSGTIDRLTGRKGSHNPILELLTLHVVDHDNLPSKVVGKELLDSILEHTKNKDTGEYIPNPKFRPQVVDIVRELAAYTLSIV